MKIQNDQKQKWIMWTHACACVVCAVGVEWWQTKKVKKQQIDEKNKNLNITVTKKEKGGKLKTGRM